MSSAIGRASGRDERITQPLVPIAPSDARPSSAISLRKQIGIASLSQGSLSPYPGRSIFKDTPLSSGDLSPPEASHVQGQGDAPNDVSNVIVDISDGSLEMKQEEEEEVEKEKEEEEGDDDEDDKFSNELSSSESEDDEEDSSKNPLSSLYIHPIHFSEDELSVKHFVPKKPVSQPNCKTALQLAHALAIDSRLHRNNNQNTKCCLLHGKLLAASNSFSILVVLACSQVVSVPVPRCTGQKVSLIVIVPSSGQPVDSGGEKTSPVPDILGWIFLCPSECVDRVKQTLGKAGCYLNGLDESYTMYYAQKSGSGSFGSVVLGLSKDSGNAVAVKLLKQKTKQSTVDAEVSMLVLAQGHPQIVQFLGCFREDRGSENPQWCIVFDYYKGGDLFDRVSSGRIATEGDAMPWMSCLLSALCFLGDRNIFHRDVKPENLLLSGTSGKVVLTDFGIACLTSNTKEMQKTSGTIGYASPEMLKREATGCEGDSFGAGVVLYFMLSKSTPFLAPTHDEIVARTYECKVNLQYKCFAPISDSCRQLILQLLKKDISERMTCQQALTMTCIRKNMVAASEPSVAQPWEARSHQSGSPQDHSRRSVGLAQPLLKADFAAPSVGALPALKRIRNPVRDMCPAPGEDGER